jgi:hypothetical protein
MQFLVTIWPNCVVEPAVSLSESELSLPDVVALLAIQLPAQQAIARLAYRSRLQLRLPELKKCEKDGRHHCSVYDSRTLQATAPSV